MKKNIIIAAIAAASALLLSVSCQKENQPESQNGINAGANTFTATIEQSITKTTITDYKVNWTSTDKISINGKIYTASPKDDDATKADFTADDGEATAVDGKFKAIYPSTLYVNNQFELLPTQKYTAGTFNAPMYAKSETQSLTFKNICAVLAIKVTSEDIATLKSIKVKSDKKLNGTFTVASTTAGYKATIGTDGTEEVVLSSDAAINLTSEGTTFYVAIPEQEYSYLKIYLSEDGTLYKRAMITKKAAGLGTIECNKIYNITYETNAVQIYANGPYWSTMNLGATTVAGSGETCYGDYYAWGETEPYYSAKTWNSTDKKWNFDTWKTNKTDGYAWESYCGQSSFAEWNPKPYDDTSKNLTGTYDAATVNWGAAWKMPTGGYSGQFKALTDNTSNDWTEDYNGVAGYKFSGQSDYSGIELFFPAAGGGFGKDLINAGSLGYYWSSFLNTDYTDSAYYLHFDSESVNPWRDDSRSNGFSVRPVSD